MRRSALKTVLSYILPCLIFSAMIVWLLTALANTSASTEQRELSDLKATIENGVTMCYAVEGAYPESVEYLCEHYGLIYDKDKYIVYYDGFASNIRPNVTILERRQAR